MDEYRIAWAAGLLEGEGCFSIHTRKNKPHLVSCAIHCEMTDQDVVEELYSTFKVGHISERKARPNRKPTYIWSVQKQKDILDVLFSIMPYLKSRRLTKAKELLNYLEPKIV